MVNMSDLDAQGERDEEDEQHLAGSGDGELLGTRDEDVPAKTEIRLAATSGSGEVPENPQYQLAASVARNLAPQLQAALTQQLQPVLDAFRVQFAASMGQALAPQLEQILLPELEVFRGLAGSVIPQLIKLPPLDLGLPADWFPRNWEDVPDLDVGKAMGIVLEEGVPLIWVPRPAIVARLVGAADADARDGILLSSGDDIAVDCLTVIGEITDAQLKPLAGLAAEAVASLRSGHSSSAQALAGNLFDTLLRDATRRGVIFAAPPAGQFQYARVRNQIKPVSYNTVIRRFRPDCVLSAALPALQRYDPSDPPPARFVRHATAHSAGPEQYTPVNAIIAVMLMTSMLREAQSSGW